MGKTFRTQKIHTLIVLLLCLVWWISKAEALVLNSTIDVHAEPLTTNQVLKLDRHQENPHRARWVLERSLELGGVSTDRNRLRVKELQARTIIHLRDPKLKGWYHDLQSFPCTHQRLDWFATYEETLKIARRAAQDWEKQVKIHQNALQVLIGQTTSPDPTKVRKLVQEKVSQWFARMDAQWRKKYPEKYIQKEWSHYKAQAQKKRICMLKKKLCT